MKPQRVELGDWPAETSLRTWCEYLHQAPDIGPAGLSF